MNDGEYVPNASLIDVCSLMPSRKVRRVPAGTALQGEAQNHDRGESSKGDPACQGAEVAPIHLAGTSTSNPSQARRLRQAMSFLHEEDSPYAIA